MAFGISRTRFVALLLVLLGLGLTFNYRSLNSSLSNAEREYLEAAKHFGGPVGDRDLHYSDEITRQKPSAAVRRKGSVESRERHNDGYMFDNTLVRVGAVCEASGVSLATKVGGPLNETDEGQPAAECLCARAVAHDIDHGMTLSHLMNRNYCRRVREDPSVSSHPMRIVQVGANTGDNANDHLVRFLKSGVAQGVLMEPVPWIFHRLSQTYAGHKGTVRLVNAAMSETDGNVTFFAPNEKSSGWLPQMGGLHLPPKTLKTLQKRHGGLRMFDKINVPSVRFDTLLRRFGWDDSPPDVFVVDAEGYDAVIVHMVLDSVERMFGATARIPILQFEWKHIAPNTRAELWTALRRLGYCVMQVHYDDIAIHAATLARDVEGLGGRVNCAASFHIR